jgi:aspartate aminotransferase
MKNKPLEASTRGKTIPRSAIRKLIPVAREAEARGVKVIKLNIGQPDIETPKEFWDAVRSFPEKVLAYAPSEGRPELLKALADYYRRFNIPLTEQDMVVTTGGIEGVLYALMAAADPGDEIVIPEPYYSNYIGVAAMAQVKFVPFTTTIDNGYHLPERSAIEKLITPKTRAILFASPGNPTGCVYTADEMKTLSDIGRDHGLFVLSDEVYREIVMDGPPATSILNIPGADQYGVIIDSVSKRYSACGARIGCIASKNKSFMDAVRALATVRLSAPALDQIGIAASVYAPKAYTENINNEFKMRRDVVVKALNAVEEVVCNNPEGAFYTMARIKGVDCEDFARWLLTGFNDNGETVLVSPGRGFYATPGLGADELRIAFVFRTGIMERAMEILAKGIRQYRKSR